MLIAQWYHGRQRDMWTAQVHHMGRAEEPCNSCSLMAKARAAQSYDSTRYRHHLGQGAAAANTATVSISGACTQEFPVQQQHWPQCSPSETHSPTQPYAAQNRLKGLTPGPQRLSLAWSAGYAAQTISKGLNLVLRGSPWRCLLAAAPARAPAAGSRTRSPAGKQLLRRCQIYRRALSTDDS